jgi:hypothetical protein
VFAAVPDRYGYLEVERNNFVPVTGVLSRFTSI